MIKKPLILLLALICFSSLYALKPGVGRWRTHFAMSRVIDIIEADNKIYAANESEILCLDRRDQMLTSISRVQGLSATQISAMAYHPISKQVILGYKSGRLDLIDGNRIYPMADIYQASISGDKRINNIYMDTQYAYLACGFGIVIIDPAKAEVVDSYIIGINNTPLQVYEVAIDDEKIYAATESGLYYAYRSSPNLNDYQYWKKDESLADFNSPVQGVDVYGQYRWVLRQNEEGDDTVYVSVSGGEWTPWRADQIKEVSRISVSGAHLLVILKKENQAWYVETFNEALEMINQKEYASGDPNKIMPGAAILSKDNTLWVGLGLGHLIEYHQTTGKEKWWKLDGLYTNRVLKLSHSGKNLLVSAGALNSNYSPQYDPFSVSILNEEDSWTYYNRDAEGMSRLWDVSDAMDAVEDPMKPGHFFFASATGGIIEVDQDRLVEIYNDQNSSLQTSPDATCRVMALAFDDQGDLWSVNSLVPRILNVRKRDGNWQSYDMSFLYSSDVTDLMVDYYNQKWIIARPGKLMVAREKGSSLEALFVDVNRGNNLDVSTVYCVVEDDQGYVWIGTERGVRVIETHKQMFTNPIGNTSSVEAKTIAFIQGNEAPELLKNEVVLSAAVDGADRKWFGTSGSGVYLISADGSREIAHFTTDNSPLLSDKVIDIIVNKADGEVFFVCDNGLISYRGTATLPRGENEKAIVFPNPVQPSYEGLISIKGLPANAKVRITDASGRLIYKTEASGGMAVWDGKQLNGSKPHSGVYLVFAVTSDGAEKAVAKIFFIK